MRAIDGDKKLDLIYLILKGHTDNKHSRFGYHHFSGNDHTDYGLMFVKGNGDGTFQQQPIELKLLHEDE